MQHEFSDSELSVLVISLITRRRNIQGLLNMQNNPQTFIDSYVEELATTESLMEKFLPGSVERIKQMPV
jgi:hypothetical protein